MKLTGKLLFSGLISLVLFIFYDTALCENISLEDIINVQKYNRAIHIMAMLLVGFGFLMVFIKKYGRSALTATYLLVSSAITLYILKDSLHLLGGSNVNIDKLILAEFAAASLLICAGAPLGRLKIWQYIILSCLFIPAYCLNEWILLDNGLGLIPHGTFIDTGGSIVIHAFGAIFGLGIIMNMTTKNEFKKPIESTENSDKFSLLGSMILWLFWPSFCSALVSPNLIPHTTINVILALSGSTIATYITSIGIRGKISTTDIANAALAGGVAIGSTCDYASFTSAFLIGITAGIISTIGFIILQQKIESLLKGIDTCGIMNLHGIPGILGGFSALIVVDEINVKYQLIGITIAFLISSIFGYISGKIIKLTGRRENAYNDREEFICE